MKLNWGSGIAIFYVLFMIVMIGMVIMSTYNKSHLVQENYYQRDINYEAFRQKRSNAENMTEPLSIRLASERKSIELKFPADMNKAEGSVTLFRPSDKSLDKVFNIDLEGNGSMEIPLESFFASGLWKIKVDWKNEGIPYFKEKTLIF